MLRLTRAVFSLLLAVPLAAAAQDKPAPQDQPAAQDKSGAAATDPMAGWSPPVVKNEKKNRQEIEAYLKRMEATTMKGDLDGAAALVDFPVLMVTDDKKGEASGDAWSREQWVAMMKPMYANPPPPGSMKLGKRTIVFMSDSLALVGSGWTMAMGPKQKVSGTSGYVLVRKGGEWKAKAMIEGGWGDTAPPPAEGAAAPAK